MPKREHVGFVVTPAEIANRIDALDRGIQGFRQVVRTTIAPRLDAAWKAAFEEFVARWAVERDSYATWDSRLFATRVMPRLDEFERSYRAWRKQYNERTGLAAPVPSARPSDNSASSVSDLVWYAGAALLLYAFLKGRQR